MDMQTPEIPIHTTHSVIHDSDSIWELLGDSGIVPGESVDSSFSNAETQWLTDSQGVPLPNFGITHYNENENDSCSSSHSVSLLKCRK